MELKKKGETMGVLSTLASVSLVIAACGATRTWTGGGDGLTWGDSLNWDVGIDGLAYNDTLVFDSGSSGAPLVTSNDLWRANENASSVIGKIVCTGKGEVTLMGNELRMNGVDNIVFTNDCPVTCAIDINLPNDSWKQRYWCCANVLKQTGTISMSSAGWICLQPYVDNCVFSGDIVCPLGQIRANTNKKLYLDGKLTADSFNSALGDGTTWTGTVYYRHASNEVTTVGLPRVSIVAEAEQALGTNAVVVQGWRGNNNSKISLYVDQTINRFATPYYAAQEDGQHIVSGSVPSALTMRSTEDCVTDSQFNDSLTLVWDPQGDYNFTAVTNHTHSLNGGIVVKRGTFSVVGTTTKMANLTFVSVADDASFVMDVSSDLPLKFLATIDLGKRARFEYGSRMRAPNIEKYPVFNMDADAKIVMPSGVAVTGCVFRAGAFQPVATYTGDDNPDPGDATPVAWIEGSGTFTTATGYYYDYWMGGDGSWTDTARWSSAFPNSGNYEARVWNRGDMTLTLTGSVQKPLNVKNFAGGLTELSVSGEVTRNSTTFLEGGVRLAVGTGGVFNHGNDNFDLRSGAELRIAGGAASFANYAKTFRLGYEWGARKPSRVKVESGSFTMSGASGGAFIVDKYGKIEMTGGTMSVSGLPLTMKDATSMIDLSGNSRMIVGSGVGTLSVTGTVELAGTARLEAVGNVAVPQGKGVVKLKLGAGTAPCLVVGGTLSIGTGSVLEIDATDWMAMGRNSAYSKKIIEWGTLDGTFDDIIMKPESAKRLLAQKPNSLRFGSLRGFNITVR